jgi:hypothetical protein
MKGFLSLPNDIIDYILQITIVAYFEKHYYITILQLAIIDFYKEYYITTRLLSASYTKSIVNPMSILTILVLECF